MKSPEYVRIEPAASEPQPLQSRLNAIGIDLPRNGHAACRPHARDGDMTSVAPGEEERVSIVTAVLVEAQVGEGVVVHELSRCHPRGGEGGLAVGEQGREEEGAKQRPRAAPTRSGCPHKQPPQRHQQHDPEQEEDVELTWALYCGSGCSCRVFCAQIRKDYKEHNRISILCHGVQYGVFCFVLIGIVFFFIWLAANF